MCADYIHEELPAILADYGITDIVKKDYINERSNRLELNEIIEKLNIPFSLQSHIMIFVGEPGNQDYQDIFGGHGPRHLVDDSFRLVEASQLKKLIVYQDEMDQAESYQVLAIPEYADDFIGGIKTFQ